MLSIVVRSSVDTAKRHMLDCYRIEGSHDGARDHSKKNFDFTWSGSLKETYQRSLESMLKVSSHTYRRKQIPVK